MTAPAQLSKQPAALDSEVGPAGARATLTRSLPAPPAPVLPIAPPVRGYSAPPARRQLRGPAVDGAEAARTRAPRPNKVVRLAAAATVTLAVVGGLGWIGQPPGPGVPAQTAVIQVGAGETVWDVAQRVAPKSDQRAVVERIRQLNGLAGSAVQPGQQLQVPDGRR
ncbi:MAG: LysM peptidoglycan-binding domain-containing protein [Pseudonocardiaceae bacterium]